jgi:hypothetical protein
MKHSWLAINRVAMEAEREQCRAEGREMNNVEVWFDQVLSTDMSRRANWTPAQNLLDQTIELPLSDEFPFVEPNKHPAILDARPLEAPELPVLNKQDFAHLQDQVGGAWAGRCAGCLLGLPFEGKTRAQTWGLLKAIERFPLEGYVTWEMLKERTELHEQFDVQADDPDHAWADRTNGAMVEDDELNFTVMNMSALRRHGAGVTPGQISAFLAGKHAHHAYARRGMSGVPEPVPRPDPSRIRDVPEPVPRVEWRGDPGRLLGLRRGGEPRAGGGVRMARCVGFARPKRHLRGDVGGGNDGGGVRFRQRRDRDPRRPRADPRRVPTDAGDQDGAGVAHQQR